MHDAPGLASGTEPHEGISWVRRRSAVYGNGMALCAQTGRRGDKWAGERRPWGLTGRRSYVRRDWERGTMNGK
jgi:hypothetical protein